MPRRTIVNDGRCAGAFSARVRLGVVALLVSLTGCGTAAPRAPSTPAASARASAATSLVPGPSPDSSGSPGPPGPGTTPAGPPALLGVRYIAPPGWQLLTPTANRAELTAESGLTIILSAAAGTVPAVTAASGRPVTIDGSAGFEAAGRGLGAPGYDVHIGVVHGAVTYDLRCHSADAADAQNVQDICDGFVQGLHWTA